MGRLYQKVMYEGLSTLCFCCSRIGCKQESYCYCVQPKKKNEGAEPDIVQSRKKVHQRPDLNFREWMMLVTKKKRLVKNERAVTSKQAS